MFIGGFTHKPNVDAMLWFSDQIFPRIIRKIPDIRLYIIGSRVTEEIRALASENTVVVGYVDSPRDYFDRCRVMVAPLRFGAGVKVKIAESMSHALPVVTTKVGGEGMYLSDGVNAMIAENSEEFADKVCMLYSDRPLWESISEQSVRTLEANFSRDVWKERLDRIIG